MDKINNKILKDLANIFEKKKIKLDKIIPKRNIKNIKIYINYYNYI